MPDDTVPPDPRSRLPWALRNLVNRLTWHSEIRWDVPDYVDDVAHAVDDRRTTTDPEPGRRPPPGRHRRLRRGYGVDMIEEDDQGYESRVEVARYVIGSHLRRSFWRGFAYAILAELVVVVLVALVWWSLT